MLEKSWAKIFADENFPAIDEERFSVLYSDKASRPNTPVNVIVGGLIIKELFDYSDDDSNELLRICNSDYEEVTEYQLFVRCLSDQTVIEDGKRRLRTKEDGTMHSSALQNPSDPDAAYRNKAGKKHRGYVANLEESVGKNGSVVTDYQYDKNTHTDSQFLKESLNEMKASDEEIVLITDGGYDGQDNIVLAEGKNVKLVTSNIRKNYHLDKLPRGKQCSKLYFGSKIAAFFQGSN